MLPVMPSVRKIVFSRSFFFLFFYAHRELTPMNSNPSPLMILTHSYAPPFYHNHTGFKTRKRNSIVEGYTITSCIQSQKKSFYKYLSGPLYPNTLSVLWSCLWTLVSLVTSGRLSFSTIRFGESKRLPLQPQWIRLLAGYSIQSLDSWVVSGLPRVRGLDLLPKVLLENSSWA